jgi:hypothetical protein
MGGSAVVANIFGLAGEFVLVRETMARNRIIRNERNNRIVAPCEIKNGL